jgi:hypothetical protein
MMQFTSAQRPVLWNSSSSMKTVNSQHHKPGRQMKTELTITEALSLGYSYAGKGNGDRFQHLYEIDDLTEEDFDDEWLLAEKEVTYQPSISPESIAEILAEKLESDVGNDTGDDTEETYRIVKALDFGPTAKMINDALAQRWYRDLTKIKLIHG